MSKAEIAARNFYDEYNLRFMPEDVRRQLIILMLSSPVVQKNKSYEELANNDDVSCVVSESNPIDMSPEAIKTRCHQAEEDAMSGRVLTSEEVHKNLEAKFPWLCD